MVACGALYSDYRMEKEIGGLRRRLLVCLINVPRAVSQNEQASLNFPGQ